MLRVFLQDEDGAVTPDWVLITAAVSGLGLAVVSSVAVGTGQLGRATGDALSAAPSGYTSIMERAGSAFRTLVSMSFDDDDTTGWSSDRTDSSPDLGTFLGPFAGADAMLRYGVALPPGTRAAEVSFDLMVLNSWDADSPSYSSGRGDGMSIVIDGHEVAFELFQHNVTNPEHPLLAPRSATVQIGDSTYRTTMTLSKQANSYGNPAWGEQVWAVQIAADTPPPGGFDLNLGSTTNQSGNDEAYGIGTFTVKAR
jgi:hypothetical protein